MLKKNLIPLLIVLFGTLSAKAQTEVFVTPSTEAIPYRIPAITTLRDGTLLAVSDYRYCRSDIGAGRIDLHLRRSTDGGQTWSAPYVPPTMQGDGDLTPGHQEAGYGDAAIVADSKSNRVLLLCCSGGPLFGQSTRDHHQGMARFLSEDGGQTWSQPSYIGEETIYKPLAQGGYGPIRAWFVGSGRILQSRFVKVGKNRRLYCAGVSRNDKETANWVIYSDDFGQTWSILGGTDASPIPGGDEPKCEELPDGSILLSSRAWGGRYYNIFRFTSRKKGHGSWGKRAFSGRDNQGTIADQNACNGEVLMVPVHRTSDGKKTHLLLQSLPLGPGRAYVGIYHKPLDSPAAYITPQVVAALWQGPFQVSPRPSAYSTMTLLADGRIGVLYEEETHCNTSGGGYTIVFRSLTIEQITDGTYSYRKP